MLDSQNLGDFWTIFRTQWAVVGYQDFLGFSQHPLCFSEARQENIIWPPENFFKVDVWMFRALALRLGKWSTGKVLSLVFMRNLSKKPINRIQMLSSKRHYRPMRVRVVS